MRIKYLLFAIAALTIFNKNMLADESAEKSDFEKYKPYIRYTLDTGLSFTTSFVTSKLFPNMKLRNRYILSGIIGMVPGTSKELYDYNLCECQDWYDVGIDVLGVGSGILLHYFIIERKKIKNKTLVLNLSQNSIVATLNMRF